jgi:hypothetical protein
MSNSLILKSWNRRIFVSDSVIFESVILESFVFTPLILEFVIFES